jgi:hypothetical protein
VVEVSREDDGVAIGDFGECFAGLLFLAIEQRLYEERHVFGPERTHGYTEMQRVIEAGVGPLAHFIERSPGGVFGIGEPRGDVHVPVGELGVQCLEPGVDSGLAAVDFLSAADQTDDHRPIQVAVHVRDEELGLGLVKPGALLLALHETSSLPHVPGALGFIKDGDVLVWRFRVQQRLVAKMVHVLNQSFDPLADPAFLDLFAGGFAAGNFVACERFAQDRD